MTRSVRDRLPDEWAKCPSCFGAGQRTWNLEGGTAPCSHCNGTGEVLREPDRQPKRRTP